MSADFGPQATLPSSCIILTIIDDNGNDNGNGNDNDNDNGNDNDTIITAIVIILNPKLHS